MGRRRQRKKIFGVQCAKDVKKRRENVKKVEARDIPIIIRMGNAVHLLFFASLVCEIRVTSDRMRAGIGEGEGRGRGRGEKERGKMSGFIRDGLGNRVFRCGPSVATSSSVFGEWQ